MVDITREISDIVDGFSDDMEPLQKRLYSRITVLIKELTLDDDGNIKITNSNIAIINDVKAELQNVVNNPAYQRNVANINSAISDITDLQDNYFTGLDPDFNVPKVMEGVQDQAFSDTVDSLTGSGLDVNVAEDAVAIVSAAVTEGSSFTDMTDELRDYIMGDDEVDGRLVSYSSQIVSDALHTSARKYNSLAVDRLDLEWFMYVGSQKEATRPFCRALLKKKYIHKSELGQIAHGLINGQQVSLAGLIEGTNAENFVDRCGGYNCTHHATPISAEMVPSNIRKKFEEDIDPDEDELVDDRPRHR